MKVFKRLGSVITLLKARHLFMASVAACWALLSFGVVLAMQQPAPASTPKIYLSPQRLTAEKGDIIRWNIRITPGTPVDTVTAKVRYDESRLEYKQADYKTSPFTAQVPAIVDASTVMVQATRFGGTHTEDAMIAELSFVAKKSGAHEINLVGGNAAVAGTATHPRIEDAKPDPATEAEAAQCDGSDCARQFVSANVKASDLIIAENISLFDKSSQAVIGWVETPLKSVGLSSFAVRTMSPWVLAAVGALGIGGVSSAVAHWLHGHPGAVRRAWRRASLLINKKASQDGGNI